MREHSVLVLVSALRVPNTNYRALSNVIKNLRPKNELTSISSCAPTRAKIPWHIPPMTLALSLTLSLTPNWISSRPRKRALPPRSTAAVSALTRVLVLRFEKSSATLLLKSDWEGMRSLAFFAFCGASHGSDVDLRYLAWVRIRLIWVGVRSARVIKCGTDIVDWWHKERWKCNSRVFGFFGFKRSAKAGQLDSA